MGLPAIRAELARSLPTCLRRPSSEPAFKHTPLPALPGSEGQSLQEGGFRQLLTASETPPPSFKGLTNCLTNNSLGTIGCHHGAEKQCLHNYFMSCIK